MQGHHHLLTMAEIKIILSPNIMPMSLNDLDEKVNFDNLHLASTSAAAVDGNDNDNIVDKETTKGCECEEEEVVCSFKTLASALLPQP